MWFTYDLGNQVSIYIQGVIEFLVGNSKEA
jgi:hypothetical protein